MIHFRNLKAVHYHYDQMVGIIVLKEMIPMYSEESQNSNCIRFVKLALVLVIGNFCCLFVSLSLNVCKTIFSIIYLLYY